MTTVSCHCGAKYNVPESAHGHAAKCKKCGQIFQVHLAEEPEDLYSLADLQSIEKGDAVTLPSNQASDAPTLSGPYTAQEQMNDRRKSGLAGFFAALPAVLLFPTRFHNLAKFLTAWSVLAVGLIGSYFLFSWGSIRTTLLGIMLYIVSEGAFAAFSFNVVRHAANGEDELPALPLTEGIEDWWHSFAAPFFGFIGTGLLAMAPAILYILYSILVARPASPVGLGAAVNPFVAGGLAFLGLFFWPMLVLAVVLGDFASLARLDRMFVTVAQTALPYCCTVALVYGAVAVVSFLPSLMKNGGPNGIAAVALVIGGRAYAQVAAMRVIGVYYNKFSDRFDWL